MKLKKHKIKKSYLFQFVINKSLWIKSTNYQIYKKWYWLAGIILLFFVILGIVILTLVLI